MLFLLNREHACQAGTAFCPISGTGYPRGVSLCFASWVERGLFIDEKTSACIHVGKRMCCTISMLAYFMSTFMSYHTLTLHKKVRPTDFTDNEWKIRPLASSAPMHPPPPPTPPRASCRCLLEGRWGRVARLSSGRSQPGREAGV